MRGCAGPLGAHAWRLDRARVVHMELQINFSLVPMSPLGATVFAGGITVPDEAMIEDKGVPGHTEKCAAFGLKRLDHQSATI